jgi:transcription elongation factor Elf1
MASTRVAPHPSLVVPSSVEPELAGFATCPSCHTEDQSLTKLAVSTGAHWQCAQCGSRWNARRLATVAAYAVWVSERAASERRTRRAGQERTR